MSEEYNGGPGWVENEDGDVVVPQGEPELDPRAPYINESDLRDTHLHFDTDEVDPRAPISRKEARRLNQEAEDDRGYSVTPKPSDVRELPGKDGRPTNWK
ncbi:MAG: hypothetical protein H6793_02165 [Candidatus Nomurabacteria bacterium]|nr:hypothetical protein [Candidatus Saccharibacteria bacterium]USN95948.1 MAG: hypothetical protein H6793_02165 [Candidatus Nomurabacteria bacterium]